MAYLDEAALEREKTKQAMIAGKQPLLGENASAAMHALGVSLGVVPPGTPPSRMTQLLESLIRGPRGDGKTGIKVDEAHPLQVQPYVGRTTASLAQPYQNDDSIGATISGGFSAAKDSSLQQMLRDQQKARAQPAPVGPAAPAGPPRAPGPGANRARLRAPVERSAEGPGYQADLAFLQERGGHHSVLKDGKIVDAPLTQAGSYQSIDPELAARLRAAGEAFEKENPGKRAQYGEFSRGEDVQKVYRDKYEAGTGGIAARPGHSQHQKGSAGDLPDSPFRQWLNAGNQDKFGVHFPVKGDAPHVQINPGYKGQPFSVAPATAAPTAAPAAGPDGRVSLHAGEHPGADVLTNKSIPAGERFNNPFNMWHDGYADAHGGKPGIKITEHDTPAVYANKEAGAAAAIQKMAQSPKYSGKTMQDMIGTWVGHGESYAPRIEEWTGISRNTKITPEFLTSPDGLKFLKAMARYETDSSKPYSLTDAQWEKARDVALNNPPTLKDSIDSRPAGAKLRAATAATKAAPPAPAQAPAQPPQAEAKPAPAAAPAAAPTPSAPPPGAAAIAATEAEQLLPEDSPDVPATVAAEPAKPATPAPAPVVATPAPAVAAAPVKPPAAPPPAPPPPAKPAPPAPPPVNPAHAVLDTKVIDLVKRGGTPEQVAQVPDFIANKTLREAMNLPMIGGRISAGVTPYLGKMGITQQQFDAAVKEGAPKPTTLGKRSEAPMLTEPGKVQYAQADTGTVSDAGPELPAEPAALVEPDGAGTSDATDFSAAARREPTVDPAVLVEQRKPVAEFFDADLDAKDRMAAVAFTEDNNSAQGRIAVHEAGANRIVAAGRPVTDIIDPRYYQAMNDPAMRHKYDAALERVKTDPQFRAQLHAEIDTAHKTGTNYSKLATDFASGDVAARSRTNSTPVSRVGDNQFFIKDRNPEVHGGTTVAANRKWKADTAAGKPVTAAPQAAAPEPGKRSDLGTSGATDFSSSNRPAPVDPNAPTLDPLLQKPVQNADGSISTVRTMGINENGKEVNIPTVPPEGGKVMTDAEARQRYADTGKHLGKFDSVEQAGAAAEKLHQDEAARISEQPKGQQPAQQPQMTPQLAEALTNVYKDESRVAPDPAPAPADALPVLPAQPTGATPGAPGGLSLAPAGLSSIPTGAIPGQGTSQGGSIAMAGMLPPIENATYSTPLLDQTAATSGAGMGLSPIAPQILQGWGWGGGGNIGAGLDWGGGGGGFDLGGGGFSMPSFGTGGW